METKGEEWEEWTDLFSLMSNDRTQWNGKGDIRNIRGR